MHSALQELRHRPWPLPRGTWIMRQSWCDLLFAHWRVPVDEIREKIPKEVEVDTFEGEAWIGAVPFMMRNVSVRYMPTILGLSNFPELNVRTYVKYKGRPGVWFFSLDATLTPAVWVANRFFHLPYYKSDMVVKKEADKMHYESVRQNSIDDAFSCEYQAGEARPQAQQGTLEHWLTERYCFFTKHADGRIMVGDVHHRPWSLQKAKVEIQRNRLLREFSIVDELTPERVDFSSRIDVVAWAITDASIITT